MIKKAIIVLIACAFIACKKDNPDTPLNVKDTIETNRLAQKITCGNTSYIFELPTYQGSDEVQQRLHKDLKNLINQNLNYDNDASLEEIWEAFISDRKEKICTGNTSGIRAIQIEHLSQNDGILSYELSYVLNGRNKRITKTFKKPELLEINITDLAKPERKEDVKRIYDINLQQSVANLLLEVKPEHQEGFRSMVETNAYQFTAEEFNNTSLGIKTISADSIMIQVSKKIDLPSAYSYINEDVKVEIIAKEMVYYLNLEPLKI